MNKHNFNGFLSLSPIIIFLLFYLAVSIIIGDFYKMPISIAFIIASIWAVMITSGEKLSKLYRNILSRCGEYECPLYDMDIHPGGSFRISRQRYRFY